MRSFVIFLIAGLALTSYAEEKKFAVVDLVKVFEAHPDTKTATTQLTKDREVLRDEFKEKSNSLKKTLQSHQELIRAGKREEAAEKLKEANELEKAIATLRTTQQRDLEEKFRQTKTQIINAISKAVRSHNSDGQYAVIFDSSSNSSNGLPQVIHAPGATDITAEIIKAVSATE